MIDLILSVCLLADPSACEEQRLSYESRGTLAQCMMLSTPYVAEWAGNHPKWKVVSWKCEWPENRLDAI